MKNDKAMLYDLFAEFYENSNEPSYVVWMGCLHTHLINELESMGFKEDPKADEGYLDYYKEATEEDLQKFTEYEFICEMMDVMDAVDYDKILIRAKELEVIDDEGHYPDMGVLVGDTFVKFMNSSSMAPVFFELRDENNECIDWFRVPVIKLKRHFKVLTLMEIKKKLEDMNHEKSWTYNELEKVFFKQESKPAIVDQTIKRKPNSDFTGSISCMITLPHEELNYDYSDEADCIYAESFYYLMDGHIQDGKRMLEESYKMGNLHAGNALAYGYSVEWFGERNYSEHLKLLRKLVRKRFAPAMSQYAFAYENGIGVKRNKRLALFWYEKAIEGGSATALANMANYYLFEEEGRPNLKKGVEYVMKAADMGNEQAMNDLGLAYDLGLVTGEVDGDNAFKWYNLAIENAAGANAEHNLARCYEKGIGTKIDLEKSEEFERLAIKHGYKPKKKTT